MPDTCQIIVWTLGQVVFVTVVWLSALARLRCINFKKKDKVWTRKGTPRDATEETLVKEIEYHNRASYGAFEFFLKIALAVLGGTAYVAVQTKTVRVDAANTLTKSGAWLLLLAAVLFSVVTFIHQKSKIERWPRGYSLRESLLWSEYWLIQGMLLVAVAMLKWVVPNLVQYN